MSDDFDHASDLETAERERALHIARTSPVIVPLINCKDTCGDELPHGKDCTFYKDCLEDWELKYRMSKERPL